MAITFEEASNLMTASFIYRNIPEDFNPPYNHQYQLIATDSLVTLVR